MRRIPSDDTGVVADAAAVLKSGGVAVLPTDTLYGFSAAVSSRAGYDRVANLKGRSAARAFVHLADSAEMVERYIAGWGCTTRSVLESIWPAPLSAILPAGGLCPEWTGGTIAFRVPRSPLLEGIISALGEPIISTSVNRSGEPPLNDVDDILLEFGSLVDLVVDAGTAPGGAPSTLVDFSGRDPVVRRRGGYAWLE